MTPIELNRAMHRGLQAHAAGDLDQAENIFRSLLAQKPNHPGVLQALGVIAAQTQHFDEAIRLLQQAVKLQPNAGQAYYNLGNALRDSGKIDEAIAAFHESIRLQPGFPESHRNLGNLLREHGKAEEAVACQRESVRLQPENPDAHNSLGMALLVHEDPEHAAEAFRKALSLDPHHADALNNIGVALVRWGMTQMNNRALDEAEIEFKRAVQLRPDFSSAWSNLGHVHRTLGRVDEALADYRKASELDPNTPEVQGDVLFTLNYLSWDDPRALLEEHRAWAARYLPAAETSPFTNDPAPDRRLRIGYVSPDFRRHVVSFFLLPLLQNHDAQNVELFAYANVAKTDNVTDSIKTMVHHWHDISGKSDEEAVAQIRSDQIDILVDLTGHTGGNRLGIFHRKPAPIQVTYLGYPNTTGIAAIDYRLTDALVDPPGLADELCVEKLWRLPDCAWCYQPPVESPEIRIPVEDRLTFACFNALAKVSPQILDLWADLLKTLPESRILFKSAGTGPKSTQTRLLAEFAKRGISEHRVDIRAYAPTAGDHLKVYFDADIALDTFPYQGTTTTCESLWMGVPVVTLAGKTHVSRVGVSLLTNVGFPQFIAQTPADYIRIAVELAQNRKLRDELRAKLRSRMLASPLMDGPQFARNVESAYREMWRKWCGARSQ